MPHEPLLEIRNLKRHVSGMNRPVVEMAHLAIGPQERLALVGPTGSGKSSLLRMIAMLDPCDSGSVRFRGSEVLCEAIPDYRRTVIYLPQQPALIAASVRDNLILPFQLGVSRTTYQESRAVALFELLGKSSGFLDQQTSALSGGERQFVSLVRAIQLDPQVLLLDEPTASLDVASAGRLESLVMQWHDGSLGEEVTEHAVHALVWVSHNVDQIDRMTNRVITLGGESHCGSAG